LERYRGPTLVNVTATRSLAELRGLSEASLSLVIKTWRAAGLSDDEVVEKLRTTFLGAPSVQSAVLKALGGYRPKKASTVEKASGPLPNTVGGAVAGAMIRGGLVSGVEKFSAVAQEQRRAMIRKDLDAPDSGDMRDRIRKRAKAMGTET